MVTDHNGRDEAPSQRGLSPKKGITRQNISAKTQLLITAKFFWPIKFSSYDAVLSGSFAQSFFNRVCNCISIVCVQHT